MLTEEQYKSYIGQYVKRFYAPFKENHIYKIKDFRVDTTKKYFWPEYLYFNGKEEWWTDCEDSCIITNELPIKDLEWVANVNDSEYKGYNPFVKEIIC